MSEPCAFCGGPVNPHDITTWKQVMGWVKGPKADSMTMREYTGKYAHLHCVNKAKAGQAPDQPSMLDEDMIQVGEPIIVSVAKVKQDEDLARELFDNGN